MGVVAFSAPHALDLGPVLEEEFRAYLEKCFRTAYRSLEAPDYTADLGRLEKRLFHSFVIGSLFANGLAVTAIAEAGPARWVAMFTSRGAPEKLAKQRIFKDVSPRLGSGWHVSSAFSVVERDALYPVFDRMYDPADVRPDSLGYLSFRAAATWTREVA